MLLIKCKSTLSLVNLLAPHPTVDGRGIKPANVDLSWGEDDLGVPDLSGGAGPAQDETPEGSIGHGQHQHRSATVIVTIVCVQLLLYN